MTTEARDHLLDYIAEPSTRTALHAYVRRRGLGDSADDVVQTVLCDALAVESVPERPSELPRFLTGIARNKVIDEHRRRARFRRADLEAEPVAPASTEARQLLSRIAAEVVQPEERRALDWLVREHQGDSLYLMALEQALEPSTLRQRICRLRKSLRARYLAPLLVLVGLGAMWAVASPPTLPAADTSRELRAFEGRWSVSATRPEQYATLRLNVVVSGSHAHVSSGVSALSREVSIQQIEGEHVTLRAGERTWVARLEWLSPSHVRLSTARGSVELKR